MIITNFAREFNKAPSKYLKSRSVEIGIEIADDALMRIVSENVIIIEQDGKSL